MKIEQDRPIFILAPTSQIAREVAVRMGIKIGANEPRIICNQGDRIRLLGVDRFHVLEAVSPRPFAMAGADYRELRWEVRDRWHIRRERPDSLGNLWVEVNLP